MGKDLNSYYCYMQDQRRIVPAWKYKSNQELMKLCDKGWKALSKAQKKKYENMKVDASSCTDRRKGDARVVGGFDSLGNPLEDIKRRDVMKKQEANQKKERVKIIVEEALNDDSLEDKRFYVMTTNVFVKVDENQIYVPAELSIVQFSLREGVISVYQAFPEAGKIPTGYKRQCLEEAEKYHKIPLFDVPMQAQVDDAVAFSTTNDMKILDDISLFLGDSKEVFCMEEYDRQAEGVVLTLADRSACELPAISFLPLSELFFWLANSSLKGNIFPSVAVAERELESERYLYKPGLSCPWHDAMTDSNHCSSSIAKRQCFTILDLSCQFYGISIVPGKHIPEDMDTEVQCREWTFGSDKRSNKEFKKPGEFNAVDIRVNSISNERAKETVCQGSNGSEPKVATLAEISRQFEYVDYQAAGTISEFMAGVTNSVGNLSMSSRTSSESDFVTLDSVSQVSESSQISGRKSENKGVSIRSKRGSRLAAVFPRRPS